MANILVICMLISNYLRDPKITCFGLTFDMKGVYFLYLKSIKHFFFSFKEEKVRFGTT